MQCFCGCERKVAFGTRSVCKRGKTIDGDVGNARLLLSRGVRSPNAVEYVRDGEALLFVLAEAVHAGTDPGPELERETCGFMAFGRNFTDGAIGAAIRRAGLSSDEAVAMLTQGEWDPFADVQMPDQPSRDNNPTDESV